MSWEMRERGGPYYTRSRRVNGYQIREYIGGGIRGQEAAAFDAEERERRTEERRAWQQTKAKVAKMEREMRHYDAVCKTAVAHALDAVGYYNRRGEWRRRGE